MGISFKGHDSNWQYWVFEIDGRDWVAVNQSTPEPLKIQFQGRYSKWGNIPLSKAGGFDIVASTTRGADKDGQNQGTVEWTWNGVRYKSGWTLIASNEIVAGDPAEGIEPIWDYQLGFVGRIAYDGPAGGAVGSGITSQAVIEVAKTKEDREIAEVVRVAPTPVQIAPSAQLSTAAPEEASPMPMAVTSRPVGSGITSQAVIEVAKTKDEREDAERRMEMQVTSTPRQIVPSAQLSTAAPEQQYPVPMAVTSRPVGSGITSQAVIEVAKTKEDREIAEVVRVAPTPVQIAPSAQLSTAAPEKASPMPMAVTSRPVTTGLVSQTGITQQNNYTTSTQSNSMGISFAGNTSDFKTWYFIIDGKTFVANNSSTLSPLRMSFTNGQFINATPEQINVNNPLGALVKNHSFDIITGTSQAVDPSSTIIKAGILEWTWAGQKYRSRWALTEGELLYKGIVEEGEKDTYFYTLDILSPYVPYDGPTGGTVGGGVVSQKTVEAQKTESTAPSGGGTAPSGGGTAPSGGGSAVVVMPGTTRTPLTTTTTTSGQAQTPAAVPGVEVAGTDWVKLGLQIGAAYLLLS